MTQFPATAALLASGVSQDISAAAEAVAKEPRNAALRLRLGNLLFRQGQRPAALEQISESFRLDPNSVETVYLLVGLLSAAQRFDAVRQVGTQAAALVQDAKPEIREVVLSLIDRARVNLGEVPETSPDPAFDIYIGAARRLAALGPVRIAGAVPSEEALAPLTRRVLDAYRAAHKDSKDPGKSTHWNRFRQDFERLIATDGLLENFRAYGLCHGLDDDLLFLDSTRPFVPAAASPEIVEATPAPLSICTLYELSDRSVGGMLKLFDAGTIASLCEAEIGGAASFKLERLPVPVNFHDLSCVHYALLQSRFLPAADPCRYLEIGGGFGAAVGKMKRLRPDLKAVLIELPETSALQLYYLSKLFPDARILTAADLDNDPGAINSDWDFLLLPSTRRELADGLRFDMAANLRSFMEMPLAVVRDYMSWIEGALVPGGICYLANRLEKNNGDEIVRMADYGIPKTWSVLSDQPVTGQPHIQERVFRA